MMDVGTALAEGRRILAAAGIDTARQDARILLGALLGIEPSQVALHRERPLTWSERRAFEELIRRRAAREPWQYIVGEAEFYSLRLQVTPQVLIPRPETELLVEGLLERVREVSPVHLADLGTGSGAIAVALAVARPDAYVEAVDVDEAALAVAAANAARWGVLERIAFHQGSWTRPLLDRGLAGTLHGIAANPPYVTPEEYAELEPEVRDYEPPTALLTPVGDPLAPYRDIIQGAAPLLAPGGWLMLECSPWQAEGVRSLMTARGWQETTIIPDYAGLPRIAAGRRPHGALAPDPHPGEAKEPGHGR
ncbi:MAG TPA: peptide chain release factor N(5)-glutamine methyltransferase [Sphingobacteriaceae bacterium]|nr:peptide chain release factor N(5)-glutamine methyltransferase [Sphingobacteriaceae bacterium]